MQRDITALTSRPFDLAIIGGGIYGASLAWEASSRGLSVALLEKNDFASATSANSLKVIHGGFRYLQHADLSRIRESVVERRNLMYMAPHLVHPLPVLVPTYGHGLRGKEALSMGLLAYEVLSADRNLLADTSKYIPTGRMVSRAECLERMPGIPASGLSGGIIFYDAQIYNSERLIIAYLQAASRAGARLANYAEVTGFLRKGGQISGLKVIDREKDQPFEVQARLVINCAGPWIPCIADLPGRTDREHNSSLARAVNFIVRPIFDGDAVGLPGRNYYQVAAAANKKSFLFVTPWRGYSLIGTVYTPHENSPDQIQVTSGELDFLLQQINQAYPPAALTLEDIAFVHAGLLPMAAVNPARPAIRMNRHYRVIDHHYHGEDGLLSVIGVKYTTARDVAQKVVDRVFLRLNQPFRPSISSKSRLPGGQIEDFNRFLSGAVDSCPQGLASNLIRPLVYNYGAEYPNVLSHLDHLDDQGQRLPDDLALLRAEIVHAVRLEMALKLSDVVLRRTELGTATRPASAVLEFCAREMGRELGWGESRVTREIEEVDRIYQWDHKRH